MKRIKNWFAVFLLTMVILGFLSLFFSPFLPRNFGVLPSVAILIYLFFWFLLLRLKTKKLLKKILWIAPAAILYLWLWSAWVGFGGEYGSYLLDAVISSIGEFAVIAILIFPLLVGFLWIALNFPIPVPPPPSQKPDIPTSALKIPQVKKVAPMKTVGRKDGYQIPLDLLNPPGQMEVDPGEIRQNGEKILELLRQMAKVDARIVRMLPGTRIIRYELAVPPYTDLNRIRNAADNLALALAAQGSVFIQIPVPGKDVIAVEVPRMTKNFVALYEIFSSPVFQRSSSPLTIALGKNVEGDVVVASLEDLPHLLIAGTTGSGKSVFLTSLLLSLIFKSSPQQVKCLVFDPKQVDFSGFDGIPHLLLPIITSPKVALRALQWAMEETQRRYQLLKEKGLKKLSEWNEHEENTLPYIVLIIDELNFLFQQASGGREVEKAISTLSQMARAAGIHLAVATQRPDVKRIEGGIKANLPARISFKLSSKMDSMTILDMPGAERLLGKGDLLFLSPDLDKPVRLQAPLVTREEIERITSYLTQHYPSPQYDPDLQELLSSTQDTSSDWEGGSDDALLSEARELLQGLSEVSVSFLQRKLKIGYNRAARLMEQMEQLGWVEPKKDNVPGQKTRKVLI
ncbi:MAG: DNA translocase FtsK [bacterium JZ-2024 1]